MVANRMQALVRAVVAGSLCAGCGGGEPAAPESTGVQASAPAAAQAEAPRTEPPAPAASAPATAPASPARSAAPPPAAKSPAKPESAPLAAASAPTPTPTSPPPEKPVPQPKPQLPLGELLVERHLWPMRVALVEPLTIERGVTLPAGHELSVYEFDGSDIVLDTGTDVFACPVAQTDVLERAFALKSALSAEQLALTDVTLAGRPDLWPVRVRTTRRLQFGGGKELPVGAEVALRAVLPNGWTSCYAAEVGDHFQAEVFETDALAQARARMLQPEEARTPFFVRSLAVALEPGGTDPELARAEYMLVYRARLGCTRCAAYAPDLAAFYERVRAADPRFEAVFWSDDKNAEDARTVREHEKLPGRAVRFDQRLAAADLASQFGAGLLPLVYVYDRNGALVAQNEPNGGSPTAADVLATLEAKLAQSR